MKVQVPESFNVSVEFISFCNNFNVTWQFKGNHITNNDKYVITVGVTKHSHYKTTLNITQSSGNDAGIYTVTITSTTGSASVNISVETKGKLLVVIM